MAFALGSEAVCVANFIFLYEIKYVPFNQNNAVITIRKTESSFSDSAFRDEVRKISKG